MAPDRSQAGYTLSEAVVVVAIVMLAALAIVPNLKQRIEQGRVDGVTARLEGALNSLRSQSLTYQSNCSLSWSLPSSGQSLTASADQVGTRFTITAFGGLSTTGELPLLLRIRPNRPSQAGDFERCLRLEPITGAISRGTWVAGDCRRNS